MVNDQQRLQILELHTDKFPTPQTFSCWKIRFKTGECSWTNFPTEAMLWIEEVEMATAVNDLKYSRSVQGITFFSDFELLDATILIDTDLRQWNMGIFRRSTKNDQDRAKKDAKKKRRKWPPLCDRQRNRRWLRTKLEKDQESDVSFQGDQDEEIDNSDKEEEWIEFIKRSTKEAQEHMKKMNIPCLIETHRKWSGRWHWESHPSQEKEKTKKEMGRRHQWILQARRNRRSKRQRLEEQQHMEDSCKKKA